MPSGFIPLPAYQAPPPLDFSPLERAVDGWQKASQFNAMYKLRQGAEARDMEQHDWRRQEHQRGVQDRKAKALGAAAQSVLSMPPEQRAQALSAWRAADKDFDADLGQMGFRAEDIDTWGPVVVAKVRGLQDPLDQEKTRAEINRTNAQADYYRTGRGKGGVGSSADERIAQRFMDDNPDLTWPEAIELARSRPADRTKRLRLGVDAARYGLTDEELNPSLERFGVGPSSPPPRQQNGAAQPQGANRFDFSGSMRAQQDAGRQKQLLDEARMAIQRGADAAKVRARLQQYGIQAPGF